jgi:hypothetical protein
MLKTNNGVPQIKKIMNHVDDKIQNDFKKEEY